MARKPPAEYEPSPLDLDYERFDEAVLRRILEVAGVSPVSDDALIASACSTLNAGAVFLRLRQGLSEEPTDTSSADALEPIQRIAASLRKELPVTDDEGKAGKGENPRVVDGVSRLLIPTMTHLMDQRVAEDADEKGRGPKADEIFGAHDAADALLVLRELLGLLAKAAEIERQRRRQSPPTVREALPLRKFVVAAGRAFLELTGRKRLPLSRHWDTGQLQGPLISFLEACCHQVGETRVQRETLAVWVRDARQRG